MAVARAVACVADLATVEGTAAVVAVTAAAVMAAMAAMVSTVSAVERAAWLAGAEERTKWATPWRCGSCVKVANSPMEMFSFFALALWTVVLLRAVHLLTVESLRHLAGARKWRDVEP